LLAQRALNFEKVHHRAALVFSAGHLPPFPRETNPLLGTISSFCSQNTPFKPNYEICGLGECASQFLPKLDFSLSSTDLWRRGTGRGGIFSNPSPYPSPRCAGRGRAFTIILPKTEMRPLGDLIAAAYQVWGAGMAGRMVQLAFSKHLVAFGRDQGVLSAVSGK